MALERKDFLLLETGPVLHDSRARKAHVVRQACALVTSHEQRGDRCRDKLDEITQLVEDLCCTGQRRVTVFCRADELSAVVAARLERIGAPVTRLTADLTLRKRQAAVKKLAAAEPGVLVVSDDAAAGLELGAVDFIAKPKLGVGEAMADLEQDIADKIQEDPYRFLICADKFQTGYDEPLLHTMYVDKVLSGIKAVQTLSRLNRAHPKKHDVFVLDFQNDTEMIEKSFADYYRTTILSKETDPNKLHTLKAEMDKHQVYSPEQIDSLVELYLGGADRDKLDPILDACVAVYVDDLDEDQQVDFKGKAKAFARTYDFLATILPYGVQDWEKLSIFLNFLIPKLPAPVEEDLAKGILEAIDMDSYRAEKKATMAIALPDADAEIQPVPTSGGGRKGEPELDRLSNILKAFNDQFGGLFADAKRMEGRITGEIPKRVSADRAYQNAKQNSDRQNARIEHDKALKRVITALFADDAQLFKQFQDNESFRHWLTDTIFELTYSQTTDA